MQKINMPNLKQKINTPLGRFLIVGGLLLVVLAASLYNGRFLYHFNKASVQEESVPAQVTTPQGLALTESLPVRLRIPTLNMDTGFVAPLGLLQNGEAEVPESNTEVGWYKYGPTPGEIGPSVIFGHVDSYTGPAVFFSLGQLEAGNDIYVDREDGSVAHFMVTKLERYPQSDFPTTEVYGDISHAGLRLITCSGIYVRGTARYTHNLVVYAKLVE
jgi:hypothetical protein